MEQHSYDTMSVFQNLSDTLRHLADVIDQLTPSQSEITPDIDCIIFTPKTKREHKERTIIQSLQKSVCGRRDKTRAFVLVLFSWQENGYIDANFNAQVMYDELMKITPMPFGYESFKKFYNHTRL